MCDKSMALKDENEQRPIPSEWRNLLVQIVEAIRGGNFQLSGIVGVRDFSAADAARIEANIVGYGAHLTSLPESTWDTSVCQWMGSYWDALIDLYTLEEGVSDLVLSVRIYESKRGYDFEVQSVHVP